MKPASLSKFIDDIRDIVRKYRIQAANSINIAIIHERWEIGRRIVEEDQNGELRAAYGTKLLDVLSKELTFELGKGYTHRNLAYYRLLYIDFPSWEILHTRVQNLTASKYLTYLPSEEELRSEMEYQKQMYLLQKGGNGV